MDAPKSNRLKRRAPFFTLMVLGGAIVVALTPGLAPWLIYDRSAILNGQIWRLFTGHWVHLSPSHLLYDSLAFGVAGGICENRSVPGFGWVCVLGSWFISLATLLFSPHMGKCGGLSGLAVAAFVYCALWGWQDSSAWRWLCLAIMVGIASKITFEALSGRMLLVNGSELGAVVSVTSHIVGSVFAILLYCYWRLRTKISANQPIPQCPETLRG